MTVGELKDLINQSGLEDDAEVRLAHQPSWPFEYRCLTAMSGNELMEQHSYNITPEEAEDEAGSYQGVNLNVLYLFEGHQLGYLPGYARDGFCV